ncbi:Leucine Rich Repeat family protein [Cladophialophora carrionii]|uniref:Leucine Rich Repeat family protein n=1 Tax=Cladophialophora carrionii TaxID=86049 RepID=A0A1C1D018_9EURO|nr:Leucine Rich Repeat family protein [Cladophialophora carrionii]
MDRLQTEDGHHFIRSLAQFIRQHEKALANSLQMSVHRRQSSGITVSTNNTTVTSGIASSNATNSTSALAAAFSLAGLSFRSHAAKAALLTLTPHHLFYLLSRMDELDITVGPMNVRLENLSTDPTPSNYVSFLQAHKPAKGRSDKDSVHSVSSMRSVMSGMSSFWSSIGLGGNNSKSEKAKALTQADLTYLYSAFTKLPSLRLTSDHRARLIRGYEEFPFDTAVPLFAFKNLQQLDIVDLDFRQFYGWDRLAEQLTLLTVKRANVSDPTELLTNIVLDDAEKRRRRSTKGGRGSPTMSASWTVPSTPRAEYAQSHSDPGSPNPGSLENEEEAIGPGNKTRPLSGSVSPKRPGASRPASSYRQMRTYSTTVKRTGSGSSYSSEYSVQAHRSESSPNILSLNILPSSKWQRLKYLSLADNSMTTISAKSLVPIASTLRSLNLSSNLFTEIPDGLASLTRLVSLDLSNCMIGSLQSLSRSPLPAVLTINLRGNRLNSLAGVERLLSLEQLNIQDNKLADPMEMARLTGIPNLKRVWVKRNPFTQTHTDYRITTFNLFRSTPGYVDDIVIDKSGPGYSERKQLVDRVPEVERQIVQPSIRIAEQPVIVQLANSAQPSSSEVAEVLTNGSRRKRAPRRRIVDLAHDDTFARVPDEDLAATLDPVADVVTQDAARLSVDPAGPRSTTMKTLAEDVYDGSTDALSVVSSEPTKHQEDYRAKVEALRQEFGSNWLSALGEQNWHNSHQFEVLQGQNMGHDALHRSGHHQIIVSGGRTLG